MQAQIARTCRRCSGPSRRTSANALKERRITPGLRSSTRTFHVPHVAPSIIQARKAVVVRVVAEDVVFLRRSLKAGQHIQSPGDVVIAGDVEPGGSVAAIGHVLVFGRLAGAAHAGYGGLRSATIKSLSMKGAKLSIANTSAVGVHEVGWATVVRLDPKLSQLVVEPAQQAPEGQLLGTTLDMLNGDSPLQPAGPSMVHISTVTTEQMMQQEGRRSPPASAALFTGTYAILAGLALMVAPRATFGLLFDPTSLPTGWIRFGGVLLSLIGMQYMGAGLHHPSARGFYLATIASRLFLVACCVALVYWREISAGLLVLAGLNLLGAGAMWLAVYKEEQAKQRGQPSVRV